MRGAGREPTSVGDGDDGTLDLVLHFSGIADIATAAGLSEGDPGTQVESRHPYDDNGRPCTEWNADARTDYTYTAKGELASVTTTHAADINNPRTLSYTYYESGLRRSMTRPGESEPVTYFYDSMNRLSVLTDPNGGAPNGGRHDFEHDAYGRRSKLTYPNGTVSYWEYTPSGAMESLLTVSSTGVPLQSWVYDYDPAGNPISKTDLDGNVERYGYPCPCQLRWAPPAGVVTA